MSLYSVNHFITTSLEHDHYGHVCMSGLMDKAENKNVE